MAFFPPSALHSAEGEVHLALHSLHLAASRLERTNPSVVAVRDRSEANKSVSWQPFVIVEVLPVEGGTKVGIQ